MLHPVDPCKNAHRHRPPACLDSPHDARTPFDPPKTLLDQALGRTSSNKDELP